MDFEVKFQAVGQQIEDIEVQNMDQESLKIRFEVQKQTFDGCFETNTTFKNILEYSRVILA